MITLTCPVCEAKISTEYGIYPLICPQCKAKLNHENEELRIIEEKVKELEKLSSRKIEDVPRHSHLPECRTGMWVGISILCIIGLVYFAFLEHGISFYVILFGLCTLFGILQIVNSTKKEKENFEFYEHNMILYEKEM